MPAQRDRSAHAASSGRQQQLNKFRGLAISSLGANRSSAVRARERERFLFRRPETGARSRHFRQVREGGEKFFVAEFHEFSRHSLSLSLSFFHLQLAPPGPHGGTDVQV